GRVVAAAHVRRRMAMDERRRQAGRVAVARGVSRRTLLQGAALGTTALLTRSVARALPANKEGADVPRPNATQYHLAIAPGSSAPDGAEPVASVLANGGLPAPEVRVREGDMLRILVQNQLTDSPTSIHWHGLLLPAAMDGVPDVSNKPIAPGQTYVYEYPIRQSGTYWYHSHAGFQEQVGFYGAFVIEPAHEPLKTEHDAVVIMSDWLHRSPEEVFAQLRGEIQPGGAKKMDGGQSGGMKMDGGQAGGMRMEGSGQGAATPTPSTTPSAAAP